MKKKCWWAYFCHKATEIGKYILLGMALELGLMHLPCKGPAVFVILNKSFPAWCDFPASIAQSCLFIL